MWKWSLSKRRCSTIATWKNRYRRKGSIVNCESSRNIVIFLWACRSCVYMYDTYTTGVSVRMLRGGPDLSYLRISARCSQWHIQRALLWNIKNFPSDLTTPYLFFLWSILLLLRLFSWARAHGETRLRWGIVHALEVLFPRGTNEKRRERDRVRERRESKEKVRKRDRLTPFHPRRAW